MKLRDKDTKKYLLTVFVATFVAYIIPAVVLYLGHFMGIMLTIFWTIWTFYQINIFFKK